MDNDIRDKAVFQTLLCRIWNVDPHALMTHHVWRALKHAGITRFQKDFLPLPEDEVRDLIYFDQADDKWYNLPIGDRANLKALLYYVHHLSRIKGNLITIQEIDPHVFGMWRINDHDPKLPLVKWTKPLPSSPDDPLTQWKKNIKPTMKSFGTFEKAEYFSRFHESFLRNLKSMDLVHLIDTQFVVLYPQLDEMQRAWFMQGLREVMKEPMSKILLEKWSKSLDSRNFYEDWSEYFRKTMTTELTAQRYSTFITSAKIDTWKGSQKAFILGFLRQLELHNDIAKIPFSDPQQVQFLKVAVNPEKNLSTVYETQMNARAAAGNGAEITLPEYTAKLLQSAEYYDAQNKRPSPSKFTRNVNLHDFFPDGEDYDDELDMFEAYATNILTSPEDTREYDINEAFSKFASNAVAKKSQPTGSTRPRTFNRGFSTLQGDVYHSLTKDAQDLWNKMAPKEKSKILNYIRNERFKDKPSDSPSSRAIKQHEAIEQLDDDAEQEPDIPEEQDDGREVTVAQREGNVHEIPEMTQKPMSDKIVVYNAASRRSFEPSTTCHDNSSKNAAQPPVCILDMLQNPRAEFELNTSEIERLGLTPKNAIDMNVHACENLSKTDKDARTSTSEFGREVNVMEIDDPDFRGNVDNDELSDENGSQLDQQGERPAIEAFEDLQQMVSSSSQPREQPQEAPPQDERQNSPGQGSSNLQPGRVFHDNRAYHGGPEYASNIPGTSRMYRDFSLQSTNPQVVGRLIRPSVYTPRSVNDPSSLVMRLPEHLRSQQADYGNQRSPRFLSSEGNVHLLGGDPYQRTVIADRSVSNYGNDPN